MNKELRLKFSDGGTCSVHAAGRKLEIIAERDENDSTALARLQKDYKSINGFIVQLVRTPPKK